MTVLYLGGGLILVMLVWWVGLHLWLHTVQVMDQVHRLRYDAEIRGLDIQRGRADVIRLIYPNEDGVYPVLLSYGNMVLDISRGVTFDLSEGTRTLTGELARPTQLAQILRAAGGWPGSEAAAGLMAEPEVTPQWPQVVGLLNLFGNRTPTIHDLVVGVTLADGDLQVISASLHDLMHVLNVGTSGWGKSTWLRAFLWQIAKAREPVEVVAIDPFGTEFNVLHGWGKLRYPVARTIDEAAAMLDAVSDEIARRKVLYEAVPLATKLTEYNKEADPLAPWVVVFDEGTASLNQKGIGEPLRDAIQMARQYGIYILLAGQSAKHNVIDTQIRDQFSTRLCFRTSPTSSRVVLDSRVANDLKVQGRAFVQLSGQELLEMQGPFISREHFLAAMTNGGPRYGMPMRADGGGQRVPVEQAARIMELAAEGKSRRQIAIEVFGYAGGAAYEAVKRVLGDTTTTEM